MEDDMADKVQSPLGLAESGGRAGIDSCRLSSDYRQPRQEANECWAADMENSGAYG